LRLLAKAVGEHAVEASEGGGHWGGGEELLNEGPCGVRVAGGEDPGAGKDHLRIVGFEIDCLGGGLKGGGDLALG
jgi:hypothetical protein